MEPITFVIFMVLAVAAQAGLTILAIEEGRWHYALGLFGGGCAFVQLALLYVSR